MNPWWIAKAATSGISGGLQVRHASTPWLTAVAIVVKKYAGQAGPRSVGVFQCSGHSLRAEYCVDKRFLPHIPAGSRPTSQRNPAPTSNGISAPLGPEYSGLIGIEKFLEDGDGLGSERSELVDDVGWGDFHGLEERSVAFDGGS
jgi:hypothetical protein